MQQDKGGKDKDRIFVKRKTTAQDLLIGLYDFLERFPICLPILNSVLKKYRVYLNGDIKECTVQTIKCILKIYIASALSFCIIFCLNPSIFTLISSALMMYFFYMEFITSSITGLELKFLKGFDSFLGIMRHYYYKCGSIKDALVMAEGDSPPLMRGHIREMCRCLNAADPVSEVNSFINGGYHKYLKLFLTLAKLVEENGDVEDEKGSVFLNSCMHLKYDIEEEARFIAEKRHRFSGLMYTAVLPVIAIPYIAMWGVSTIASLNLFYNGYAGACIKMLLIAVTFICYNALLELRDGERLAKKKYRLAKILADIPIFGNITELVMKMNRKKAEKMSEYLKRLCEVYKIKTFYMLKILYYIGGLIAALFIFSMGHAESARIYKYDIPDVSQLTSTADSRQLTAMERLIPEYTAEMIEKGTERSREELIESLLLEKDIKNAAVAGSAADEILKRVLLYYEEHLTVKDLLLALLAALILYKFPDTMIFFKKSLIEGRVRDEIMQFQSIIHMLKKVPGTSVISLLEEMERFSEIFKPAVKQCINEYSISEEAAISRLYESEKDPEWRRLADCFMMADEIGIEDAFEEISSEIENFKENRKLDRKILLDTEGMLGAVIAILPGGFILFGYLLCPFMIRSMQIFNEYQSGITMSM
ncbi:MAG: hypothetical protein IKP88_12435 [Lachnospiraceae bacterium]|nr:hypothetical protein [Lachnospiraceae bacterium]